MASAKKKLSLLVLFAAAVCLGSLCFFNKDAIEFPLTDVVALDAPYIVRDYGESRYILDKQRARIVVVDKQSNVVRHVLPSGEKEGDTFYYADDFMVDKNGFVFVKEGAWDGNRIAREAVLVYDAAGRYDSTYLDWRYREMVNKHKVMLLGVEDGTIKYAVKNPNNVVVASYDYVGQVKSQQRIPFRNAFDFVADMTLGKDGSIYLLEKAGRIFRLGKYSGIFEPIYTAGADEFPNWMEPSDNGKLLFSDLYSDSVVELNLANGEKRLALENSGAVTVPPVPFGELKDPVKNPEAVRKQRLLLLCAALFLALVAFFVFYALLLFFRSKMHVIQRITVYIVLIVMGVAGTITYKLTGEFSKVMRVQILSQMENMAYSVANTIRPATLDSIDSAQDFASPAYRQMIENMKSVIDPSLDINKNVYCDVFKYDEKRGAYACAYLDQAIGTYFPLTAGEAKEIKEIYKTARAVSSSKDDTSASYTYVSVPVVNDLGMVRGVVSVMTENFMLTDQINSMKKSVLLGIVVTLIFVWLAMGELLSYILSKSQAQMDAQSKAALGEKVEKVFPYYYIRIMVFALFAAYNMTTTFLPMVVAKGAMESLGEGSGNFFAALPISVNLFIIGLMALFCEGMIRKAGCKKIVALGAALSAVSNLIVFLAPFSYALLFFALLLDGVGVGLTTNSMYLMVSQIPDAKNRTSGYAAYNAAQVSGINFGMMCGAALASSIGRRAIFPLVSVMWLVSALLFFALYRTLGLGSVQPGEKKLSKKRAGAARILSFLRQRRVWSFILFIQAPFALMGSFVYYYLPLYSDANGLSEVMVAVLMMLYSMFAIYLGGGLTKWVIQKTGPVSPYAAIILSAAGVVVYAAMGNFAGLLAAIFVLGLANGFGRSVQQAQFSMLDECEKYGVPDAMGIFNFTDFIGQSFGPAVMGIVFLSKSLFTSTAAFAILLLLVSAAHLALNFTMRKK